MIYFDYPVTIPEIKGKITYRPCRKGGGYYVLLETGRRYVSEKQYTLVDRMTIGRTIDDQPGMMKPSKHYLEICGDKLPEELIGQLNRIPEEPQDGLILHDNEDDDENNTKRDFQLLSGFLEQQKYALQTAAERRPNGTVSKYIIQGLNAILVPLHELMKDEDYACFLPILTEPKEYKVKGERICEGMSYLEVYMTLERYGTAIARYRGDHGFTGRKA